MRIDILHLVEGAKRARGLAVIIDVFRAFSLACYLFDRGVEKIIPVGKKEQAFALKESHPDFILIGERDNRKIPGFDFGNSPFQTSGFDFSRENCRSHYQCRHPGYRKCRRCRSHHHRKLCKCRCHHPVYQDQKSRSCFPGMHGIFCHSTRRKRILSVRNISGMASKAYPSIFRTPSRSSATPAESVFLNRQIRNSVRSRISFTA